MSKYYIFPVSDLGDSFTNNLGDSVFYLSDSELEGINFEEEDLIVIYKKAPISAASILLKVINIIGGTISMERILEVSNGVSLEKYAINNLEVSNIIEISKELCQQITKEMTAPFLSQTEDENTDDDNLPRLVGGYSRLLYGVPGCGKSHYIKKKICSDESKIIRVVFHEDYSFSDFVGQIMPKKNGDKLEYEFVPGPFTNILKKAVEDRKNMYYLIIEEINRGNAPAIFGDLFQLIERNDGHERKEKQGESSYWITNYEIAKEVYGDPEHQVRIPSNLSLVATMNTADQNVFTLDTAFKRRWSQKHIPNIFTDSHDKDMIEGSEINWGSFQSVTNERIGLMGIDLAVSGDKRLGAYFATRNDLDKSNFSEKILKYLWDDVFKMDDKNLFFRENNQTLDQMLETYQKTAGDPLESVLIDEVYTEMKKKMD